MGFSSFITLAMGSMFKFMQLINLLHFLKFAIFIAIILSLVKMSERILPVFGMLPKYNFFDNIFELPEINMCFFYR